MSITRAEAAVAYATGASPLCIAVPVVPMDPETKVPLIPRWGDGGAPTSAADVRTAWGKHPDASIGAVLRDTRLVVVDIEGAGHGHVLDEVIDEIHAAFGPLPTTLTASTKGGGRHLYFKAPETTDPDVLAGHLVTPGGTKIAGVDIKKGSRSGNGGLVIVPTDIDGATVDGRRWEDIAPVAPLPDSLRHGAMRSSPTQQRPAARGQVRAKDLPIPEGERNIALTSIAGTMRRHGMGEAAIAAALLEENRERCQPPLADNEVRRIAQSVSRYAPSDPWTADTAPAIITLSSVEPRRVEWLWPGYIPLGKITEMSGKQGIGKSTLAYDIAARISTGRPMPDGRASDLGGPADCLLIATNEDNLADTIKPRLIAARADHRRIHAAPSIHSLAGIDGLRDVITAKRVRFVFIDALMSMIPAGTDSYKDDSVRRLLHPLAALAEETDCAILTNRHVRKGASSALDAGIGSTAFSAVARSGLVVGREGGDTGRCVLAVAKGNLSAESERPSWAFDVVSDLVDFGDGGKPMKVGRIDWVGPSDVTAESITTRGMSQDTDLVEECADYLRELLADGPLATKEVSAACADLGYRGRILREAQKRLGITRKDKGLSNSGRGTPWMMRLPDSHSSPAPRAAAETDRAAKGPVATGNTGCVDTARLLSRTSVEVDETGTLTQHQLAIFADIEELVAAGTSATDPDALARQIGGMTRTAPDFQRAHRAFLASREAQR